MEGLSRWVLAVIIHERPATRRGEGRRFAQKGGPPGAAAEASMLSTMDVAPILAALLSRGGEFGDLFHEEVRSLTVVLEDGKVERVLSGTDSGVGIRLVFRGRTFHAYTNDCGPASLAALARSLSRYAERGGVPVSLPDRPSAASPPSPSRVDPGSGGVEEKVRLVALMDRVARSES